MIPPIGTKVWWVTLPHPGAVPERAIWRRVVIADVPFTNVFGKQIVKVHFEGRCDVFPAPYDELDLNAIDLLGDLVRE